jgi:hypothetical protein
MMKRLAFLLFALPVCAQVSNPSIVLVSAAPSGSCTANLPDEQVITLGTLYSCQSGTWTQIAGGGGGGGITALTQDVTASGTGSVAATVAGIQTHALPTLATGYLNWTGTTFAYTALGTFATANAATPPAIGGTTPANGTFAALSGQTLTSSLYRTNTNCANGASPAVCAAAPSGAVAVPTGTNSTLVVDTTAVTANSRIMLTEDSSVTISGTTCNTTLNTGNLEVTARTASTSFTITFNGTIGTNPLCVSYSIVN